MTTIFRYGGAAIIATCLVLPTALFAKSDKGKGGESSAESQGAKGGHGDAEKTHGASGKEKGGASAEHGHHGHDHHGDVPVFSTRHRDVIVDWFSDRRNVEGLPPGLAKKESLPPGLEKQLQRNGTLPPGLEKKLHPVPSGLVRRLPPPPRNTRYVILGEDVLLLDERSSAIVDIIRGIVRFRSTF